MKKYKLIKEFEIEILEPKNIIVMLIDSNFDKIPKEYISQVTILSPKLEFLEKDVIYLISWLGDFKESWEIENKILGI